MKVKSCIVVVLVLVIIVSSIHIKEVKAANNFNLNDALKLIPYTIASGVIYKSAETARDYCMFLLQKLPQDVVRRVIGGSAITVDMIDSIRQVIDLNIDLVGKVIRDGYYSWYSRMNPMEGDITIVEDAVWFNWNNLNRWTYFNFYVCDYEYERTPNEVLYTYVTQDGETKSRVFLQIQGEYEDTVMCSFFRGYNSVSRNIRVARDEPVQMRMLIGGEISNDYRNIIIEVLDTRGEREWVSGADGKIYNDSWFNAIAISENISTDGYEEVFEERTMTDDDIAVGPVLPVEDLEGMYVRPVGGITESVGLTAADVLTDVVGANIEDVKTNVQIISNTLLRFFDFSRPIDFEPLRVAGEVFTTRFPFSLPFDLYNAMAVFNNPSQEPDFDIHIEDKLLGNGTINVDMTIFDNMFEVIRSIELILFTIGLIFVTRRLLGGDV